MVIVCLLPFVTQIWQIYAIVLSLNVFYAFFTSIYTSIPLRAIGKRIVNKLVKYDGMSFD